MKHSHYFKSVAGLDTVDVYRVLDLFGVTDPCIQHAAKKLLVAGGRGHKDIDKDIQDAIDTLERWKAIRAEDEARAVPLVVTGLSVKVHWAPDTGEDADHVIASIHASQAAGREFV